MEIDWIKIEPGCELPVAGRDVLIYWPHWRSIPTVGNYLSIGIWQADCALSDGPPPTHWKPLDASPVDRPVQEAAGDNPNDISKDERNGFVCGAWKTVRESNGVYVMRCDRPDGHLGYHVDKVLLTNWDGPTPKEAQDTEKAREEAAGHGFEEWAKTQERALKTAGHGGLARIVLLNFGQAAWTACADRSRKP